MRQIDFSDGYETAAAPDQGVITTGGFGSYSSDANFVAALVLAGGTLSAGHAYYNSVTERIRFYDGALWIQCLTQVDDSLFMGVYANDAAYIAAIALLGEALQAGSFYFNSGTNETKYYDGTVWRTAVATDLQQTITNKDIDLGTATASRRITISKGTFAAINALARKAGTIYYATDGAGAIYFDNGAALVSAFSAPVSSVNGFVGVVVLDSDDIAEGSTNLYWTETRQNAFQTFKRSVRLASTTQVLLTDVVPLSIDGSTVAIGDRVLLAGQSSAIENGIYTYNDDGVNYTLTRAVDADGSTELVNGTHVYVSSGTLNGGFLFYITTLNPFTIGTNAINFSKLGAVFIEDTIVNGVTTKAPSQNAVFDALALKEDTTNKGIANGYAALDGSGTVPIAQLPSTVVGAVDYKGTWNANTNTPDLPASTPDKGDYYVVSVSGSTSLGGITDWVVGDWAIYNGTVWEKVDNSESVTSVNGFTGTVVLDSDDVAEGATNLYFTDLRAQTAVITQVITNGVTDKSPSEDAVFDALALKQSTSEKDAAGGYAGLDGSSLIANSQMANVLDAAVTDAETTKAPTSNAVYDALYGSPDYVSANIVSVAGAHAVGAQDKVLLVDTTAARTITLPTPARRKIYIKDVSGQAETNNITLARNAAENIEGLASDRILNANFGSWLVVGDGTNWHLL